MRAYADADDNKVKWCKYYIQKLRDVSYRKLDEATAHVAKVHILKTSYLQLLERRSFYRRRSNSNY